MTQIDQNLYIKNKNTITYLKIQIYIRCISMYHKQRLTVETRYAHILILLYQKQLYYLNPMIYIKGSPYQ